jgi:glucose dehydrogenase
MQTKMGFGEGASPALYGDSVIINWDHEGSDFIAALDKRTGKELWRTPRDEGTGWSTPLVVETGGKQQVIVNATGKVRSYDLKTGKVIWSCGGQTVNAIPPQFQPAIPFTSPAVSWRCLLCNQVGRHGRPRQH